MRHRKADLGGGSTWVTVDRKGSPARIGSHQSPEKLGSFHVEQLAAKVSREKLAEVFAKIDRNG